MNKCKLCNKNSADKKNTHFLTDAIIRPCLNYDSSRERERGLYYDIDNNGINCKFQRSTPPDIVKEGLHRDPTEEEIKNAMKNPCSVNNIFCSNCEKIFTKIEIEFIKNILPKLRNNSNIINKREIVFHETGVIRLFFYLQLWRSYVCKEDNLYLKKDVVRRLKYMITNYDIILKNRDLYDYPMSITYLQTNKEEYTENIICFVPFNKPNIIFMNDFVIQFYDDIEVVKPFNICDLYDEKYINYQEKDFVMRIFSNEERKDLLSEFFQKKVSLMVSEFIDILLNSPIKSDFSLQDFMNFMSIREQTLLSSKANFKKGIDEYINNKSRK